MKALLIVLLALVSYPAYATSFEDSARERREQERSNAERSDRALDSWRASESERSQREIDRVQAYESERRQESLERPRIGSRDKF